LAHSAGTATTGVDYAVPPNQVLSWAAGDFATKLINIPIAADARIEAIERFRLTLSDPVSTASLQQSETAMNQQSSPRSRPTTR